MTLRELKEWIMEVPEDLLDYPVMNGEYGTLDGEVYFRKDTPITTLLVDTDTNEVLFLNDENIEDNAVKILTDGE
jgi:hypothetical protein